MRDLTDVDRMIVGSLMPAPSGMLLMAALDRPVADHGDGGMDAGGLAILAGCAALAVALPALLWAVA